MRVLIGCLASLLLCVSGLGAEISGPTSTDAGKLAVFTISGTTGDVSVKWLVLPDAYEGSWLEVEGGRVLVFASPRVGRVSVIAAVNDGSGLCMCVHDLDNGGSQPPPPPPPPPPTPSNSFADVVASAGRITGLKGSELADGLSKMAAGIERVLDDPKAASLQPYSFRSRVRESVNAALGSAAAKWYSFSNEASKVFEKLNPRTTQDHIAVYRQLIAALKAGVNP